MSLDSGSSRGVRRQNVGRLGITSMRICVYIVLVLYMCTMRIYYNILYISSIIVIIYHLYDIIRH